MACDAIELLAFARTVAYSQYITSLYSGWEPPRRCGAAEFAGRGVGVLDGHQHCALAAAAAAHKLDVLPLLTTSLLLPLLRLLCTPWKPSAAPSLQPVGVPSGVCQAHARIAGGAATLGGDPAQPAGVLGWLVNTPLFGFGGCHAGGGCLQVLP